MDVTRDCFDVPAPPPHVDDTDRALIRGQLKGYRNALAERAAPPQARSAPKQPPQPRSAPEPRAAAAPQLCWDIAPPCAPPQKLLPDLMKRDGPSPSPDAGGKRAKAPAAGTRSDCVKKVEKMQQQRELRRRRAAEARAQRLEDAEEARECGGVDSVDFLRRIREYRAAHGIREEATPFGAGSVWSTMGGGTSGSTIRVVVRKRPMLKTERLAHDFDVISCPSEGSLIVHEPRTKVALRAHRTLTRCAPPCLADAAAAAVSVRAAAGGPHEGRRLAQVRLRRRL